MLCRPLFFLLPLAVLIASSSGQQAAVISTELNGDDLHFLSAASEIGVMQIKLNEIARARSSNYAVTTFSESLTRGPRSTATLISSCLPRLKACRWPPS